MICPYFCIFLRFIQIIIFRSKVPEWPHPRRRPGSWEDMCPTVMEELESTGSIPEVVETPVVNITTESTSTNTILDTLERLEWGTSTFTPTTPICINPVLTWTNCGHLFLNRQGGKIIWYENFISNLLFLTEQSTPDSLTRLQLLTALELVFTR